MVTKKSLLVLLFGFLVTAGIRGLPHLAYAANADNGATVVSPSEAAPAPLVPVPIVPDGLWQEFGFTGTGSFATGCFPADPAGPTCTPSASGNSVFVGPPPWTFTVPSDGATLTVTDAFLRGDIFAVYDFGVLIGSTSAVGTGGDCGSDPVPCLADPLVSHGVFALGAGPHSITIKPSASPFSAGAAYFRVEAKFEHMLCYKIMPLENFVQREVIVQNQFGKQTVFIFGPDTLCVPSSKQDLATP